MHPKEVLILSLLVQSSLGAKILALMAVVSHSHHLWNVKYLETLARRGHHITYVGVDKYENPPENISHILVENVYEALYEEINFSDISQGGPYWNTYMLHKWEDQSVAFQVRSEGLRRLNRLIRKEKFDLVVHDIGASPYLLGAVDVLGRPPVIGITAFGIPTWVLDILGNPMAYSSKPHFLTFYADDMSALERANNYFLHLFSFAVRWLSLKKQDEYSRSCFGQEVRPLPQILDDINIIMVNSNYAIDYPFPKVPGLIPVGGLHIREPRALPQDLKSYLDEAKSGVIFFSLGSNIASAALDKEKIAILVEAFRRVSPVRILWKWESEFLPNKPDNVKFGKWLPQNDILAHPNVRLFFTHSGMLSTQEAIYHGKPIVGMPFFLDQHVNVYRCKERGLGERLDFASLTVEKVVDTITKVLTDSRYGEKARNASAIFRDEFGNPMDRAIYWTEYTIRHRGAPHLRYSGRTLAWYKTWLLDILAFILSTAFLTIFIIIRLFKRISAPRVDGEGRHKHKRN